MSELKKLSPQQQLQLDVEALLAEGDPQKIKRMHRQLNAETKELNPLLSEGRLSQVEQNWLQLVKYYKIPLKQWVLAYEAEHGEISLEPDGGVVIDLMSKRMYAAPAERQAI